MSGVVGRSSEVPFFSTVTGGVVDGEELGSGYWYRNLRAPVRFETALRALLDAGHRQFVEVSPHPVLTTGIQETAEDQGVDVSAVGTLRRDDGGEARLLKSLAEAYVAGAPVAWAAAFKQPPPHPAELPTYAFQRRRFWMRRPTGTARAEAAASGMEVTGHALLDRGVPLPGSDGFLFTGRLSLRDQPWLEDHAVLGRVVVPGTALLDMVLHAADAVGCDRVDELALETPLVLTATEATQVQVLVTAPDTDGNRQITVHGRPRSAAPDAWVRHARATLTAGVQEEPVGLVSWPPVGARVVDTAGLYERLGDEGLVYGPAFRGLGAVWRGGDGEVFAEVALPDVAESAETGAVRRDTSGFGIHPALLDGALHAWLACADDSGSGTVRLPFLWTGVSLYATGATMLRVRLTPTGPDDGALSVLVTDPAGLPVLSARSLVTRPVGEARFPAPQGTGASLYRVVWSAVAGSVPEVGASPRVAVIGEVTAGLPDPEPALAGCPDLTTLEHRLARGGQPVPDHVLVDVSATGGGSLAEAAEHAARHVLGLVRQWLTSERFTESRLVLVTRGAVAVEGGERVDGLAASPVWGLVRSAQTEHPGRFTLLDVDVNDAKSDAVRRALASGEPQVAVRGADVLVPEIVHEEPAWQMDAEHTGEWRLTHDGNGTLEGLAWTPDTSAVEPRSLGEFEVRVDVRAAGVNFRDVLVVLGVYPGAE
ncbi:polyketide synthase dehydratase domain-containing protein, partial [Streptomyces javensis]|uniref:polyketide synthase dehydratase domain-containing protein n=1 Tax=Streptomyces javensis TaxID=114698 RepID=UPI0033FF964A